MSTSPEGITELTAVLRLLAAHFPGSAAAGLVLSAGGPTDLSRTMATGAGASAAPSWGTVLATAHTGGRVPGVHVSRRPRALPRTASSTATRPAGARLRQELAEGSSYRYAGDFGTSTPTPRGLRTAFATPSRRCHLATPPRVPLAASGGRSATSRASSGGTTHCRRRAPATCPARRPRRRAGRRCACRAAGAVVHGTTAGNVIVRLYDPGRVLGGPRL